MKTNNFKFINNRQVLTEERVLRIVDDYEQKPAATLIYNLVDDTFQGVEIKWNNEKKLNSFSDDFMLIAAIGDGVDREEYLGYIHHKLSKIF